ncbi:MAG: hypothetical protein LBD68_01895, partial [Zoogloeaceae bacterium]|nr:hypothetical protein [Zoogloeaceae bacterium]
MSETDDVAAGAARVVIPSGRKRKKDGGRLPILLQNPLPAPALRLPICYSADLFTFCERSMDIHQILEHLPHRYPLLLVDR